jgi:hypothetical protein
VVAKYDVYRLIFYLQEHGQLGASGRGPVLRASMSRFCPPQIVNSGSNLEKLQSNLRRPREGKRLRVIV